MVELLQAQNSTREQAPGNYETSENALIIERHGQGTHSVTCKWNISGFGNGSSKQKVLYSKYFEVGGYDCRLLVYPAGDAQALPGYMSVYLQISDPGSNSSKWDCFASYQLAVRNLADDSKTVHRDSWHRFSAKKRSHGWCDFASLSTLLDPKQGFLGPGGIIQVSTDITILDESVSFTRESDLGGSISLASTDVFSGKFVWRVQNFSVFQPLLRTQKIMSPAFPAGECSLRMSVYQSTVGGADFLSVCLESKDTERSGPQDRSCWCLFRLAVQPQAPAESENSEGVRVVHRDSYGRFASDSRSGDNTSLGWNDFMKMSEFLAPGAFYLVGDTAVFSASFHVIRESTALVRHLETKGALTGVGAAGRIREKRKAASRDSEWTGRFQWRLENFTRLKDLLKKRKITGLCIKSKRFSVGGRDCRLIVYPRGQSQPPTFLSVFLEVTDPAPLSPNWTCFVSHRLSVINQRGEADRSVSKESQNRYSKTAKDWGWREFVSLTTLFDVDAGFLVNDSVVFSAEVIVLKESSESREAVPVPVPPPTPAVTDSTETGEKIITTVQDVASASSPNAPIVGDSAKFTVSFTWRVENFLAFKEVVETRKIFSQFFNAGPCDLRLGLYESFDSLCVYLESDAAVIPPPPPAAPGTPGDDSAAHGVPEKPSSHVIRYRAAILNQRHPEKTQWREGSVFTRSWNNSVLQFPRTSSAADSGRIMRDSLVVLVEIIEVKPWTQDAAEGAAADPTAAQSATSGQLAGSGHDTNGQHGVSATQQQRLGEPSMGYSESSQEGSFVGSDEDDEGVEESDGGEGDFPSRMDEIDIEEALGRWMLNAGIEMIGPANPPLLCNVLSIQKNLQKMLTSQGGAMNMFIANLRMYMSSFLRVHHLLLPAQALCPDSGNVISHGSPVEMLAPSVMTILAEVPCMRSNVMSVLLDVMLDHTLTAKMHKHLFAEEEEGGGSSCGKKGGVRTSTSGRKLKAPSTPKAGDNNARAAADIAADSNGNDDAEDPFNDVADCTEVCDACDGYSICGSPAEELSDTLSIILGWMRTINPELLPAPPTNAETTSISPLSTLHKVSMLLSDAPLELQADIIALVPQLISQSEHTAAAGALLGRLAEASKEGSQIEATFRLPVLAALGSLEIDPQVAHKVLQAAMKALPALAKSELPPAIGLVLKLAAGNESACRAALEAVRLRVGSSDADTGSMEAMRLACMQYPAVARALLVMLRQESLEDTAKQTPQITKENASAGDDAKVDKTNSASILLSVADVHVLLDSLALPVLRDEAVKTIEACASAGRIADGTISECIWLRNANNDGEDSKRGTSPNGSCGGGPEETPPADVPASGPISRFGATGLPSIAQRSFLMECLETSRVICSGNLPEDAESIPPEVAKHLRLHIKEKSSPSGLPPLADSESADELGGVLAAADTLLLSKSIISKRIAFELLISAFKHADPAGQRRVLKSLIQVVLSSPEQAVPVLMRVSTAAAAADWTSREPPTVDEAAPAAQLASSLIFYMAMQASAGNNCAALSIVLEAAANSALQVKQIRQAAAAAATKHAQQLSTERSAVSKAKMEVHRAAEQVSDLESQMTRLKAEHRAELAGLASDRKEIQARLRAAEQQVEWVKSERDEERTVRNREAREASQRAADIEAQLTRLKAARLDEQKRFQKEKNGLLEHIREVQEALESAHADVARARNEASMAVSRSEKAMSDARRRAEVSERTVATKDSELASLRAAAAERDALLQTASEIQRKLEQQLASELQRVAMLSSGGAGLSGRLAQMSPAGKAAYLPASEAPQQHGSSSQQPSLAGHGSMGSLIGGPGGSGLFDPGNWGLDTYAGRPTQAPTGHGQDDASMEKLLGLLPSDLLHS